MARATLKLRWTRWVRFFGMFRGFVTMMRLSARLGGAGRLRREGRLTEALGEYEAIVNVLRSRDTAGNPVAFSIALAVAQAMTWTAQQLGVPERARGALEHALAAIEAARIEAAELNPGRDARYAFEKEAIQFRDALSRMPSAARN